MIGPAICRLYPLAVILAAGMPAAAELAEQRLTVTVSSPEVKIRPVPPGRGFIRLPDLEYLFLFEATCVGDEKPAAISLSVADSRLRIEQGALAGIGAVEATLTVPARQIAPLPLSGFCERSAENDGAPPAGGRRRIAAALSAQAALHCSNDGETSLSWVAESLDVTLVCEITQNIEEVD